MRAAARLLLALAPLLLACEEEIPSTSVPVDLDRQCIPERGEMACREGLLCIRLFLPQVIADGGLGMVANCTCRKACTAATDCPQSAAAMYTCYTPAPPPMSAVCVRKEVADRLQMDGGL